MKSSASEYQVCSDSEITIPTTMEMLLSYSQTNIKDGAIFASAVSLSFLLLKLVHQDSRKAHKTSYNRRSTQRIKTNLYLASIV